jgi:hypothetical protein
VKSKKPKKLGRRNTYPATDSLEANLLKKRFIKQILAFKEKNSSKKTPQSG